MLTWSVHCEPLNINWPQECWCVMEFYCSRINVLYTAFLDIFPCCPDSCSDTWLTFSSCRTCPCVHVHPCWDPLSCPRSWWTGTDIWCWVGKYLDNLEIQLDRIRNNHLQESTNHILQWKTTFTEINQSHYAMENNIHWNQPITFCNGKQHSLESTNHILQWKTTFTGINQSHSAIERKKSKEWANNILNSSLVFVAPSI